MRFLIKYSTRGRPQWFKKAIENIEATISTTNYLILVSADLNDPTMNCEDIKIFCRLSRNVQLVFGNSASKVDAINRDMDKAGEWDILVNMSDDMEFIVKGWDKIIEQQTILVWPEGDWFAHYNDGVVGDALPTMSIMDRKYYNRTNYIYYPEYKSFSCDAEAMYVAILLGRHHYFNTILFMHFHSKHFPKDQTYKTNSLATAHDTALYFSRLNINFGVDYSGVTPFDKYKTK